MKTQGQIVSSFIESYAIAIRGVHAGKNLELRPFQQEILNNIFALDDSGRWKHNLNVVMLPRKSGKSMLVAGIAVWALFCLKGRNHQIFAAAGSRDQAKIVFEWVSKFITQQEELRNEVTIYKDGTIECHLNDNIFRVLSSDADNAHGLEPSISIVDELWRHPNGKLTEALMSGSAALDQHMTICISTPGAGEGSYLKNIVDYGLRQRQQADPDPSFYMYWLNPPQDVDHTDERTWEKFIPGLDDFVARDFYRQQVKHLPENEFRRLHLAQWTSALNSFLPYGVWEGLPTAGSLDLTTPLVLGVDGAWRNDSTGIVGCTPDGAIYQLALWERPEGAPDDWHTPVGEIREKILELCALYNVRAIAADPWWLNETLHLLSDMGYPIEEFRTDSPILMTPATQGFYQDAVNGDLSHDHNPKLAEHIANAFIQSDRRGMRIKKEEPNSPNKIDLAMCAIIARHVAKQLEAEIEKDFSYI